MKGDANVVQAEAIDRVRRSLRERDLPSLNRIKNGLPENQRAELDQVIGSLERAAGFLTISLKGRIPRRATNTRSMPCWSAELEADRTEVIRKGPAKRPILAGQSQTKGLSTDVLIIDQANRITP